MDCQYANNCPTPPPPPHGYLPMTGFEVYMVIGFAVACFALALLLRLSHRGVDDA